MKPILFSTEMVQAILDNRKSQTRRVVKPQLTKQWAVEKFCKDGPGTVDSCDLTAADMEMDELFEKCRYGKIGTILWVRETWARFAGIDESNPFIYKADGCWNAQGVDGPVHCEGSRWKPSIHMPKGACRLFLKITDIRVERLQDISEEDAIAEGVQENICNEKDRQTCPSSSCKDGCCGVGEYYNYESIDMEPCYSAVESYETLWTKINGPDSWNLNPWVFVISFECTEKPQS